MTNSHDEPELPQFLRRVKPVVVPPRSPEDVKVQEEIARFYDVTMRPQKKPTLATSYQGHDERLPVSPLETAQQFLRRQQRLTLILKILKWSLAVVSMAFFWTAMTLAVFTLLGK